MKSTLLVKVSRSPCDFISIFTLKVVKSKARKTIKVTAILKMEFETILKVFVFLLWLKTFSFCTLGLIQNLHLAGISIFSEGLGPVGWCEHIANSHTHI